MTPSLSVERVNSLSRPQWAESSEQQHQPVWRYGRMSAAVTPHPLWHTSLVAQSGGFHRVHTSLSSVLSLLSSRLSLSSPLSSPLQHDTSSGPSPTPAVESSSSTATVVHAPSGPLSCAARLDVVCTLSLSPLTTTTMQLLLPYGPFTLSHSLSISLAPFYLASWSLGLGSGTDGTGRSLSNEYPSLSLPLHLHWMRPQRECPDLCHRTIWPVSGKEGWVFNWVCKKFFYTLQVWNWDGWSMSYLQWDHQPSRVRMLLHRVLQREEEDRRWVEVSHFAILSRLSDGRERMWNAETRTLIVEGKKVVEVVRIDNLLPFRTILTVLVDRLNWPSVDHSSKSITQRYPRPVYSPILVCCCCFCFEFECEMSQWLAPLASLPSMTTSMQSCTLSE